MVSVLEKNNASPSTIFAFQKQINSLSIPWVEAAAAAGLGQRIVPSIL